MRKRPSPCRLVFLAALAVQPSVAQSPAADGFSLGAGAVFAPRPYVGVDTEIFPVPLLQYRKGGFYVQGLKVGYRWLPRSPFIISVLAQPFFDGYEASDSTQLTGMQDRDPSVNGGFALGLALRRFEIEYSSSWDLIDQSDGGQTTLDLRFPRRAGRWLLTPGISVVRLNEDWVDYYYGVRPEEAISGVRPAYRGSAATNLRISLFTLRKFDRWAIFAGIDGEALDSDIENSPIVDTDRTVGGKLGILFTVGR